MSLHNRFGFETQWPYRGHAATIKVKTQSHRLFTYVFHAYTMASRVCKLSRALWLVYLLELATAGIYVVMRGYEGTTTVCCTDTPIISYNTINNWWLSEVLILGFHAVYVVNVQQINILTKIGTFDAVFTHFNMLLSITYLVLPWNAIATYDQRHTRVCSL